MCLIVKVNAFSTMPNVIFYYKFNNMSKRILLYKKVLDIHKHMLYYILRKILFNIGKNTIKSTVIST